MRDNGFYIQRKMFQSANSTRMSERTRHHMEENPVGPPCLCHLAPPPQAAGDNTERSTLLMTSAVLWLLGNVMESATW